MSLIYAFFIVLIIVNICVAQRNYQFYKLQDYELCQKKPFKKFVNFWNDPKLNLSFNKPINIKQTWDSTTISNFNMNCKFRVKTLKNFGIYAVITKLKFRKNKKTNNCIDYIEFSHGHFLPSQRICDDYGTGDENDKIFFDYDRKEEVQIKIYVNDTIVIEEPLEMEIYLTSHGSCNTYGFKCDSYDINSCISKELVGDNVPNCMKNCTDEESCFYFENIKRKLAESVHVDYSHIVISAVTSLIFTMFAVGTIVYTCWKYWYVCYPRPIEQTENNDVPTIELPESPFNGSITNGHQIQDRPPSPKDLPPSYEDLFPDR